jgi:hypothetical protein
MSSSGISRKDGEDVDRSGHRSSRASASRAGRTQGDGTSMNSSGAKGARNTRRGTGRPKSRPSDNKASQLNGPSAIRDEVRYDRRSSITNSFSTEFCWSHVRPSIARTFLLLLCHILKVATLKPFGSMKNIRQIRINGVF